MTRSGGFFPFQHQPVRNVGTSGTERRQREATAGDRPFGALKAQLSAARTPVQRSADRLTRVASSTAFLIAHMVWLAAWILMNSGLFGFSAFDPFPFGLLTLVLSIEAIFLTIFVLMSQGREAAIAELREEMTLQVNLRIEREVTKTLQLVAGLYARLEVPLGDETELRDMLRPLDPDEIKRTLELEIEELEKGEAGGNEEREDAKKVDRARSQTDDGG